jgi:hypothetical protein
MTQTALVYANGAFMRGDARLVVMTRGQYGDNAPSHKEVDDAQKEIAAAVNCFPDMLEALELAEGWIDAERESEETGEGQQARWILETMRAAIAKAKAVQS